jgi:hypothetical protein
MNFIWRKMKNRIVITNDGEIVTRIATIDGNIINYTESPGIKVTLEIESEQLIVKKVGLINMKIIHKLNYTDKIDYTINLNGNEFFGNVEMLTKSLKVSNKLIELTFMREGDLVYQKWEIE